VGEEHSQDLATPCWGMLPVWSHPDLHFHFPDKRTRADPESSPEQRRI